MAVRRKRSVSMPPDLDAQIEAAAAETGMSYSGWLAAAAGRELTIRAGLEAVREFERSDGAFSTEEIADAESWADEALQRSGAREPRRRFTA
ncbi:MAG: hypothetical protein ACRD0J_17555 [Acidimicrobiales bacterium]